MNSITPAQLSVGISTPFAPISSDLFSRIISKSQKSGYGTWHVWQDTSYHAPHAAIIRTEEKRTFTVPLVFARALSQNGPRAPFAFHRKVDPKHQIQDPMKPSCRTCVLIPMYSETLSGAPEDVHSELSPYKKAADMLGLTLEILYNWDRSPSKKPIRIVNQLTRW